jgi:hypothetical protein
MRIRLASLLAASLLLTGCGGLGAPAPAQQPSNVARAQSTHEYPAPPPPPQHAAGGEASAAAAVRAFATAYINWTAATVAQDMRRLAARSVGQARSVVALAGTQTAGDYELKRGGIANSGIVEAVASLPGHRNEYVVVTREQTTATNTTAYEGLRPAWHVALATVRQLATGVWVLSGWQPEG